MALLKLMSFLVPVWLIQRAILLGALVGAGLAAHVTAPAVSFLPKLYAGTLYIVNPFTMARLGAGHWRILVAYALAPWAVRAIIRLLDEPSRRRGLLAGAWLAAMMFVSAHALLLGVFLFLVLGVVLARHRSAAAGAAAASVLVFALGVGWWGIPAAAQGVPPGGGMETLDVFATTSVGDSSVPVTALGLRGFWVERLDAHGPPGWQLLSFAMAALALAGTTVAVAGKRRAWVLTFAGFAVVSVLVAIGVSSAATAPVARALYEWVPGSSLFREPHKALAVLALAYAWLGSIALDRMVSRGRVAAAVAGLALLLPLGAGGEIFDGASGRVAAAEYPLSWRAANDLMMSEARGGRLLVLPWQQYAEVPFARGAIANPAAQYFDVPTIASRDPQLGPGPSPHRDPVRREVDRLVANPPERFGAALAHLGIRYVVFVPNGRVPSYLLRAPDLKLVLRAPELLLFSNEAA